MAADVKNTSSDVSSCSLAPMEARFTERPETLTPALAQGTEPGAGQDGTMFAHSQSYEDLTTSDEGPTSENLFKECEVKRAHFINMRQIIKDFGELSSQLTDVPVDMEEEMRDGSEIQPELLPKNARRHSVLSTGKEEEDMTMESWCLHQKHVFVLSEAGKPMYSRYWSEEALSSTIGVMMALVSFLEVEKNAIRSIHADGYKVVFVRRTPLVLLAVAHTRQSEQEIVQELLYIYYQIISLLTWTQLNHIFQRKQNYDLR